MNITDIDISRVLRFKALSEPIRIRMLAYLSEPRTVKQVADILGIDHHSLYHHMRVLEKAGLVELVKTCDKGNITEKYFQLVDNWIVMHVLNEGVQEIKPLVRQSAFSVLEDMEKSLRSGIEHGTVHRIFVNFDQKKLKEKRQKINELIKEFIDQLQIIEDQDGSVVFSVNVLQFQMPEAM